MMVGNANQTNHVRVFYLTQLGLPFSHNLEFICLGKGNLKTRSSSMLCKKVFLLYSSFLED